MRPEPAVSAHIVNVRGMSSAILTVLRRISSALLTILRREALRHEVNSVGECYVNKFSLVAISPTL
jgi:hypothetical protein